MVYGISNCSNGQNKNSKNELDVLKENLNEIGIDLIFAKNIYISDDMDFAGGKERAEDLMDFYKNPEVDGIFDISGGDIANETLEYLDYDIIKNSNKTFWGYSDLTTIINAIYTMTGKSSVLYYVRNAAREYAQIHTENLKNYLTSDGVDLFDIDYEFYNGNYMSGVVVGGNIRCFLKLAGTKYFPDMKGKILFIESLGSDADALSTYFAWLSQLGVFKEISGIMLGKFNVFEEKQTKKTVYDLLKPYIDEKLPVAKTNEIGHFSGSKAIMIGEFNRFTCIKTERLSLKPLSPRYLETTNKYASDKEVTKYMMYLPVESKEETLRYIVRMNKEWRKEKPTDFEFVILKDGVQVGGISLSYMEDRDILEFGWILDSAYQRQGIAYEAATGLLKFAESVLKINHFIAHCDSENTPSYSLMEKLGMKRMSKTGGRWNRNATKESYEYLYEKTSYDII